MTDWRTARADAHEARADVIINTLAQLIVLEECEADDDRIITWLRQGVGLLKTCARDHNRAVDQLRAAQ